MTDTMKYPFGVDKLTVDPGYAALREGPLRRVQLPYGEPAWLATRYEDVKTVLADPRFSRAAAVGRDEPRTRPHATGSNTIMSYDPPEHSRLRRLVTQAFTVRRVEALRARAQQIADELVDAMLAKGPPEQVRTYVGQLSAYMADLIAQRRTTPRDDLLTALVAARDNDDRLSEEELLIMAQSLLIAGHETTASQIPNLIYQLLTHPDQLATLRADLDLIPRAVEELLRFTPLGAGGGQPRYALEDIELGGVTVSAGEPVIVAVHAANRDETVFTRPDELDLTRHGPSHVAFGHGAHHCLGAPLARMELQVTLHTLLTRLPGLRLAAEDDIVWKTGLSTRGPERMPITWDQP